MLGEFSGVHAALKEGLLSLGHNAVVASDGDGWKGFPRDFDLGSTLPSQFGHFISSFYKLHFAMQAEGYDVVQLINPYFIDYRFLPYKKAIYKLLRNNKKLFFTAAGDDAFHWRYAKNKLRYRPQDDFLKYDKKSTKYHMLSNRALKANKFVANAVHGIIPILYEYQLSYEHHKNLKPLIPIPINLEKIKYSKNTISNKMVVFHGLNRYGFKGTRHVEEAFKILAKKYPNDLELIIAGGMPIHDYLKLIKRTNVIIDQVNSYSLGVNGVISLAMGKVVLGGAEPESLNAMGVDQSPVVNIRPSANDIVAKIELILDKQHTLETMGHNSRKFAECNHDHIDIASKYVEAWN